MVLAQPESSLWSDTIGDSRLEDGLRIRGICNFDGVETDICTQTGDFSLEVTGPFVCQWSDFFRGAIASLANSSVAAVTCILCGSVDLATLACVPSESPGETFGTTDRVLGAE